MKHLSDNNYNQNKLTSLPDAVAARDAVNKRQLDRKAPIELMGPITGQENTNDTFVRVPDYIDPSKYTGPLGKQLVTPTPQPNEADGEMTHPSVIYAPDGWNGFKYWMAVTPYKGGNDAYEDPCILVSHDGDTWIVPPGLTNPLDDAPGGTNYNSDTYLAWGPDNVMHIFWRNYNTNDVGNEEKLYVRTSNDGINWTPKQLVLSSDRSVMRLFSPSFIYEDGTWSLWAVSMAGATSGSAVRLTATSVTGPWSSPVACDITPRTGKRLWHLWVGRSGKEYIALVNDTLAGMTGARDGDLLFATSRNGINWTQAPDVCLPRVGPGHTDLYQATAVPAVVEGVVGFDVWYSARITVSPAVWHIFRTFLSPLPASVRSNPRIATGFVTGNPSVPANGGNIDVIINFPPGLFTATPAVTYTPSNARLNLSLSSMNSNMATLRIYNWTGSAAGSGWNLRWMAIQTD